MFGVTQILAMASGVTQIFAFLDTNMSVSPTRNSGVGGLGQRMAPTRKFCVTVEYRLTFLNGHQLVCMSNRADNIIPSAGNYIPTGSSALEFADSNANSGADSPKIGGMGIWAFRPSFLEAIVRKSRSSLLMVRYCIIAHHLLY